MTLMTILEAAKFLRLTKRTLYQRTDIPRVRYGHRIMFVKEDLEKWVYGLRQASGREDSVIPATAQDVIDGHRRKVYHRNPLFVLPRSR